MNTLLPDAINPQKKNTRTKVLSAPKLVGIWPVVVAIVDRDGPIAVAIMQSFDE